MLTTQRKEKGQGEKISGHSITRIQSSEGDEEEKSFGLYLPHTFRV
jgi:hypothetical protein